MNSDTTRKLLAPFSTIQFFQSHWENELLYIQRDIPDYYDEILTVDHLEGYFQARHVSPHFVRVLRAGVDYELSQWTNLEYRSHTDPGRVIAVDKLFRLFSEGATLILIAAQTGIPTLDSFCKALSKELQMQIQANIYLTPPQEQGLVAHYDPHDVFVLQISGTKQWRFYDKKEKPVRSYSLPAKDYEGKEPETVVDLRSGDLLYVPRGTVHLAQSTNSSSVHVTIGLLTKCWFNLIEELAVLAEEDPKFRRALPHGLSSAEEKAAFLKEFTALLGDLVASNPIELLLERTRVDARPAENLARLSDLLRVRELHMHSIVSLNREVEYEIEDTGDAFTIKFGSEDISLPRFMKPAIESLLRSPSMAVGDIVGPLSSKTKLELVTTLVEAGFLRIEYP